MSLFERHSQHVGDQLTVAGIVGHQLPLGIYSEVFDETVVTALQRLNDTLRPPVVDNPDS